MFPTRTVDPYRPGCYHQAEDRPIGQIGSLQATVSKSGPSHRGRHRATDRVVHSVVCSAHRATNRCIHCHRHFVTAMSQSQSTPTDPSSLLDISSASAAAVLGMRDSSCASGATDSSSALAERERSPPESRRLLARTPRKSSAPYPTGHVHADNSSAPAVVHNQMLSIGAMPQQVLAAQHFAVGEAANRVAAQAERLHQASMNERRAKSVMC